MPDVNKVDETTTSPSEENQTPATEQTTENTENTDNTETPGAPLDEGTPPKTEDGSQKAEVENKVPYDRFQEVVEDRNKYKELLDVALSQGQPAPQQNTPVNQDQVNQDNYGEEDISKTVEPLIDQKVNQKMGNITRQMELDRTIAQNPDFYNYADNIKEKIQENPYLSWGDAYKLAKYDSAQKQARNAGRQEGEQKVIEKKKAGVESASKAKSNSLPGSQGKVDPLAKGPDGEYLYSTKELEDVLPKAK